MVTHSSILAWRIPWMEEPGGLQSMGSQRVRQDWATSLSLSQVSQRQILWLKRWMFNINRLRFEYCLIIYPGKVSQSPLSSVSLSLKCWEIIHTSHGGCNNRAGHVRAWTVPSIQKKKKKIQNMIPVITFLSFSICLLRTEVLSIAKTSTDSSFSNWYLFTPTITSEPVNFPEENNM